jgi:N-acetylmuramoyl-L-alanine amidase
MTEDEIRVSLSDTQCLAVTLYGEARGESVEGRIAVGAVVRNRVAAQQKSVRMICLADRQFSCWNRDESSNHQRVLGAGERLLIPDQPLRDPLLRECLFLAEGIVRGALTDNTDGATHYVTTKLYESDRAPAWVHKLKTTVVIGQHTFLRT